MIRLKKGLAILLCTGMVCCMMPVSVSAEETVTGSTVQTVTRAAGKLEKGADYTDDQEVTFGDAPFSLGVTANHAESSIQYHITDEKDADGNAIGADDGHILSVSADGMVTINTAGSAKIRISLPESKNYTAPADLTVNVKINRKDLTIPEQSRTYLYDEESDDTILLAALLPLDSGSVTYSISSKDEDFFNTAEVAQFGKLHYTVKKGKIGDKGEIRVGVKTTNYTINGNTGGSGQIMVKAELADRKKAVPKIETVPVPGAYVYHPTNTLASDKAKAVLNAGAKVQGVVTDAQGNAVAGNWSWKEASEIPNAGVHTYTAVFTPENAVNYATVETPVTLTVEKAYVSMRDKISSLSLPSYRHGEYLYNHELTTGSAYYAGKGDSYNDVDKNVMGVLGRYVWAAPGTKVNFAEANYVTTGYKASYELEFIPDDTDNYAGTMETKNNWSGHKKAWVFLYRAENPPYRPSEQMTVASTCQKVGDVSLPKDWKWFANDADTPLVDDQPVAVYAEYTGSDAECYFNSYFPITITRSTCDHAQTEVRNAKAASCMSEGSTGETWCKVCSKKLDDGCVLVKDVSNHEALTETVVRAATTDQTGLTVRECSACGYYKEVTTPKISGGGDSTGGGGSSAGGGTSAPSNDTKKEDNKTDNKTDNKADDKTDNKTDAVPKAVGTTFTVNGATYRVTSSNTKKPTVEYVKAPKNAKKNVTVPKKVTVNGVTYEVTGIAQKAFSGRKKIKTIVIPETITSIQKKAFADCPKLEKIVIRSEKLKDQNLDEKAFEGVKEDVIIQVPKKKLSGFRKLFVKKGLDRKVKCKAIKAKKK